MKLHTAYIPFEGAERHVLFLHDAWGCVEMWGDFPKQLGVRMQANALLYDRIGHGRSPRIDYERRPVDFFVQEADKLIELLDLKAIRKATLYGHSDGGTIALVAAARHPERVEALILESAHTHVEPEGVALVAEITERAKQTRLLDKLQEFHGENTSNLFNYWSRMWSDPLFKEWNIIDSIKKISCPILAFRGEHDPFDTVRQNLVIAEYATSKVQLELIPQAAHNAHRDNPTYVLELVANFEI